MIKIYRIVFFSWLIKDLKILNKNKTETMHRIWDEKMEFILTMIKTKRRE